MPRVRLWSCFGLAALISFAGCGSAEPEGEGPAGPISQAELIKSIKPTAHQPKAVPFPKVRIKTSQGDIVIKLHAEKAPRTVENFLAYVDSGHYNGTIFHHVRSGDIVMGGGYGSDLKEKAKESLAAPVRNEAREAGALTNVRGTIAMARELNVIDSSRCQFFFNLADNDYLDPAKSENAPYPPNPTEYGFCAFGEVVEGMDVLDRIGSQEVSDKGAPFDMLPKRTVLIQSIYRMK